VSAAADVRARLERLELVNAYLVAALGWYADPDNWADGVAGEADAPWEQGGRDEWVPDNGDRARAELDAIRRAVEAGGGR